mmetsp:Transcript_10983/g.20515  ORF Transcript_10983/g.20515 Transcript_10983/m.20515 type:complete len:359 (-) Transcript_10983:31-1107(-)
MTIQHDEQGFVDEMPRVTKDHDVFQNSPDSTTTISLLRLTREVIDLMTPSDFCLPPNFLQVLPKDRPSASKSSRTPKLNLKCEKSEKRRKIGTAMVTEKCADDESTSSRTIPYDPSIRKSMRSTNDSAAHAADSLASMQKGGRGVETNNVLGVVGRKVGDDGSNTKSYRAARANQRRMLKDTWITGGVKETMKGREHALRFGKSLIHGWGVFSDEEINAGELIVEYRGVLIGNAVADRRQQEYERAKLGSDYMFRIDSETVCDATHQGCVARFINASCTPNCHTQIITVNGVKRIAIYAKKHIQKGEELCYDYKFELEYDESKRIPCNCGSTSCRGFMNWDQRYVSIIPSKQLSTYSK